MSIASPWHVRRFGVIRAQRSPSVLWSIGFDGFRASCHWHIVSGIQMQDLWFLDVLKMIRAKLRTKWTTGGTVDDDDDWQIALFLTSLSFGLIYVDCYIHFWHDRLLPITIFFLSLFLSLHDISVVCMQLVKRACTCLCAFNMVGHEQANYHVVWPTNCMCMLCVCSFLLLLLFRTRFSCSSMAITGDHPKIGTFIGGR